MNLFSKRGPRVPRPGSARRRAIRLLPRLDGDLESRMMLTAGPFGLNLSPDVEFVNAMKTASDWTTAPNQTVVTRDANGWPTSDASVLVLDDRVNMSWNGPDPNAVQPDIGGTYTLSFQGQATVAPPNWLQIFAVQNQAYNPATNTTTAQVVVQHNAYPFLQLNFTNTVNPASATKAGVTNVQLLRPGYALGTSQVYTTEYLNALAPFGTIRYLNVDDANAYAPTYNASGQLAPLAWSQRRLPSADSQVNTYNPTGMSWEYMIALANATNTDMWINIPGPATDAYATSLAQLIKNGDTVNGVAYAGPEPGAEGLRRIFQRGLGRDPEHLPVQQRRGPAGRGGGGRRPQQRRRQRPGGLGATLLPPADDAARPGLHQRLRRRAPRTPRSDRSSAGRRGTGDITPRTSRGSSRPMVSPRGIFYGMGNADYLEPDRRTRRRGPSSPRSRRASPQTLATTVDLHGDRALLRAPGRGLRGGAGRLFDDSTGGQYALAASRDPLMEQIVAQNEENFYAAGGGLENFYDGPWGIWGPQWSWEAAEAYQASNPVPLAEVSRAPRRLRRRRPVTPTVGVPISPTAPTALPLGRRPRPAVHRPQHGRLQRLARERLPGRDLYALGRHRVELRLRREDPGGPGPGLARRRDLARDLQRGPGRHVQPGERPALGGAEHPGDQDHPRGQRPELPELPVSLRLPSDGPDLVPGRPDLDRRGRDLLDRRDVVRAGPGDGHPGQLGDLGRDLDLQRHPGDVSGLGELALRVERLDGGDVHGPRRDEHARHRLGQPGSDPVGPQRRHDQLASPGRDLHDPGQHAHHPALRRAGGPVAAGSIRVAESIAIPSAQIVNDNSNNQLALVGPWTHEGDLLSTPGTSGDTVLAGNPTATATWTIPATPGTYKSRRPGRGARRSRPMPRTRSMMG